MLIEVFDDGFEAQVCTNPAQIAIAMEPSSFAYEQIWHNWLRIHVQTYSNMLHEHGFIKRNGSFLKYFAKNLRESFE
jgi:hypothetical protein